MSKENEDTVNRLAKLSLSYKDHITEEMEKASASQHRANENSTFAIAQRSSSHFGVHLALRVVVAG